MLQKRRCPITGVVNFYSDADPHVSVGSVFKVQSSGVYHWRSYTDDLHPAGVTKDLRSAERAILSLHSKYAGGIEHAVHPV